jgi:hypothetical protein
MRRNGRRKHLPFAIERIYVLYSRVLDSLSLNWVLNRGSSISLDAYSVIRYAVLLLANFDWRIDH